MASIACSNYNCYQYAGGGITIDASSNASASSIHRSLDTDVIKCSMAADTIQGEEGNGVIAFKETIAKADIIRIENGSFSIQLPASEPIRA